MSKLKFSGKNTIGTYNIGSGFNDVVYCIVEEPYSGKTYVGGGFTTFNGSSQKCLVRLNADGSKDTSFDIGDGFDFNGGSPGFVRSVVVDTDGKIYVGGWFDRYDGTVGGKSLIKLNTDATIATEFDISGGFNNAIYDMVLNSDGKLYVVGVFKQFTSGYQYYLIRLNIDGTKDTDFAVNVSPWTGGFNENSGLAEIQIDTDGKIFVCGIVNSYSGTTIPGLIKFNTDGTVDTTFSPPYESELDSPYAIKLDSSGNLYVGGDATVIFGPQQGFLIRLDSGGTIDTSFDGGVKYNASINDIDIDINEKIIISGAFTTFSGLTQLHLLRLNIDGTKDYSLDVGRGFYYSEGDGGIFCISSISGKTYVGGIFNTYQGISQPFFIRLNSDGSNDMTRTQNKFLNMTGSGSKYDVLNFNNDVFVDFPTELVLSGLTEPISFYMYLDSNNYSTIGMLLFSCDNIETDTKNELIVYLDSNYLYVQVGLNINETKRIDITNFTNQAIFVQIKRTDNGSSAVINYVKFNGLEQTLNTTEQTIGVAQQFTVGILYDTISVQYIYKLYDATIWDITISERNHWNGYTGNVDSGWLDTIGSNNGSVSGTTKTTRQVLIPSKRKLKIK